MKRLCYVYYLLYYAFCRALSIFARHLPYYKDLWLTAERKTEARDNGYHFFRYMRTAHPEVNCAFIIDSSSPDYKKVSDLGKIIQPRTFRHMLAFACAKVCVSTHYMSCAYDTYGFAVLNRFGLIRKKSALIRHGITSNDLTELHYPNARVDILVCSAVPEYESMVKNYGHPDGVVQRLGLCRYDRLMSPHDEKRCILVMPTWRYFLRELPEEEFAKSEYYRQFYSLINNEKLNRAMEEHDYTLTLYLHYELRRYSKLFKTDNPRIEIAALGTADVQDLLMESSFLVTDYSSVYFDFAYMGKPFLYLPFDEDKFYKTQYKKGYFDCRTDGFGPAFADSCPAAEYIAEKICGGMKNDEVYKRRADAFFGRRCANHCEMTYNAVTKLINR